MEAPPGALIAYATSPGKTARDGIGRNSLFTSSMLLELVVARRDMAVALTAVQASVQKLTRGEQTPWGRVRADG